LFIYHYPALNGEGEQSSWDADNYVDYILLRPGTDVAFIQKEADNRHWL